jgi:predicted AlkP superfamily pyrophosphatase or phosphodiesterase
MSMTLKQTLALSAAALALTAFGQQAASAANSNTKIKHVLLISVDGLHEVDVSNYVASHPQSAFSRLRQHGISYIKASTSRPSDSSPGLLALVSGASPRTSGVYYDDSYDRALSPPGDLACAKIGTETMYAENIDKSYDTTLGGSTRLDGGGGINELELPRDPANGCTPVYPHKFLRVNTIFNVAHQAGLYTAWSDKHPAYDMVRGRGNTGAEDLYTPEINSPPHDLACTLAQGPGGDVDDKCSVIDPNAQWTSDVSYVVAYDGLKVQAVVNEIQGLDHTGTTHNGVPAIFGMNFQAVSVGQKLTADGYTDAAGTPSAGLAQALNFVDSSLGRFLDALQSEHIDQETLVIVGAKHGQSPIDVSKLHMLIGSTNPKAIADVRDVTDVLAPVTTVAQATEDDISLIWLAKQSDVGSAVAALTTFSAAARVWKIYSGSSLVRLFDDPLQDPRTPDLIVQPIPGTIYSKSAAKIAEHGGFAPDDTHTALIVSNPQFEEETVSEPVTNLQVAPTILEALGLDPEALDSVRLEHTRSLPAFSGED